MPDGGVRTSVITGATGGIGGAVARAAARLGHRLVIVGRDGLGLERLADGLLSEGADDCMTVVADLADIGGEHASAVSQAVGDRLDLLVNSAGSPMRVAPLQDLTMQDWMESYQLHVVSPMLLQQSCFGALSAANGVVVNIGSVVANAAPKSGAPYAAAKAALATATRSTAIEWAREGIRSVVIEPGFVDTGFNADLVATGAHDHLLARVPTRRAIEPDEVARLVFALSDPNLPGLTGSTLTLDGGLTARL